MSSQMCDGGLSMTGRISSSNLALAVTMAVAAGARIVVVSGGAIGDPRRMMHVGSVSKRDVNVSERERKRRAGSVRPVNKRVNGRGMRKSLAGNVSGRNGCSVRHGSKRVARMLSVRHGSRRVVRMLSVRLGSGNPGQSASPATGHVETVLIRTHMGDHGAMMARNRTHPARIREARGGIVHNPAAAQALAAAWES